MIKLSKLEESNPFRFHDSVVNKQVRIITDEEVDEVETVEVAEDKDGEKVAEEDNSKEQKETV